MDASQAAAQQLTLEPHAVLAIDLCQNPSVAVARHLAKTQRDNSVLCQFGESRLGGLGQPPGYVFRYTERRARRIDSDKADAPPVLENERIALVDFCDVEAFVRLSAAEHNRPQQERQERTAPRDQNTLAGIDVVSCASPVHRPVYCGSRGSGRSMSLARLIAPVIAAALAFLPLAPSAAVQGGDDQLLAKIAAEFGGRYDDAQVGTYVTSIGQVIVATTPMAREPFTFTVLNSDIVNAFSLPGGAGGHVFIP